MLIDKATKSLILNASDPSKITTLIPTASTFDYKGRPLVVVPDAVPEARVLTALGLKFQGPIRRWYDWPRSPRIAAPFAHQMDTADFLTRHPRCFVFNGMGTGKTLSVLWAFDYLRSLGLVERMVVVSPLSTLERAWGDEVFRHFLHLSAGVLHGTPARRKRVLDDRTHDIYLINHDGLKSQGMVEAMLARKDITLFVVDEIAQFRNAGTDRWKALRAVTKDAPHVWGLTGTPTPNEPTDAWGQCRLVVPQNVSPYRNAFKDLVMRKTGPFSWVPRPEALEIVNRAMRPSIRYSREECIDLPPTTVITRECPLTPQQQQAYNDMRRQLRAEYEGGLITAANQAVKQAKLLQIGTGVAYAGESVVYLPVEPRLNVLRELIEESEGKVLVFLAFTAALERVAKWLNDHHISAAVVHGQTSKNERDAIFNAFQNNGSPRVLVANPYAMAHGLTLTAASTTVWFGPITSNEVYEQANARTVRPGQTRNTLIAHLESTAAERKAYAWLQTRGERQFTLLDMLEDD